MARLLLILLPFGLLSGHFVRDTRQNIRHCRIYLRHHPNFLAPRGLDRRVEDRLGYLFRIDLGSWQFRLLHHVILRLLRERRVNFRWLDERDGDRPHVIRQAIHCCRKGGTVSIPGVYGGLGDKIPLGAMMNKALTIKTGQTHVHKYVPVLLEHIRQGRIDPSFVVTHRLPLSEAPRGYEMFRDKKDGCIKVVLDPSN
jgi:hypothetical protein